MNCTIEVGDGELDDAHKAKCYASVLRIRGEQRALSQGYAVGFNPYNSAETIRAVDFEYLGATLTDFHRDEAFVSVALANDEIRREVLAHGPLLPPGAEAIKQASYSAVAVEQDRRA